MKASRARTYRDPVHDTIDWKVRPEGVLIGAIIDCPEFQRLRFIRQLGMANLVFHGAEHSRFSHSMGVAWLAARMCDAISSGVDPDERLAVVCAALLHDVGHAPFSHATERAFHFSHEDASVRIVLSEDTEVHRVLSAHDAALPGRVARLISGTEAGPGADIISSQLDADRFDYLRRDALMTGVRVGGFDLERIISRLGADERGLWVDIGAWEAVEGYLLARYHMYRLVYFHRSVRAAESMLELLFRRAGELVAAGRSEVAAGPLRGLMEGNEVGPEMPTDYDAWTVIDRWRRNEDAVLSTLATGLLERRLFRTLRLGELSEDTAVEVEQRVRTELAPKEQYLFFVDSFAHAAYHPYRPAKAGERRALRIRGRDGTLTFIEDHSPVVRTLADEAGRLRRWYVHPSVASKVERSIRSFRP